jgi:hypothetical protein
MSIFLARKADAVAAKALSPFIELSWDSLAVRIFAARHGFGVMLKG